MNREPVTALTMLLLAAFVIDRVASAVTFLFSRPSLTRTEPEVVARREWNRRLLYFCATSALAIVSLGTILARAQVLSGLGLILDPALERVVMFILLVGGADRISAIVKTPEGTAGKEATSEPIEVRGTLRIDDSHTPPANR